MRHILPTMSVQAVYIVVELTGSKYLCTACWVGEQCDAAPTGSGTVGWDCRRVAYWELTPVNST